MISHSRPWLTDTDQQSLLAAVQDECLSQYRWAEEFREALLRYSGAEEVILAGSGTMAIFAALRMLRLPQGSKVAISAYTCYDVARAVYLANLVPEAIDCTESGLLQVSALNVAIASGRISAVIAVHPFGMIETLDGADLHGVPVIEDCAHVPPAFYLQNSLFSAGSLESTKLLGAGEGGYLLQRGIRPSVGPLGDYTYGRCADLVARLALNQLRRLEENLQRRERIADAYSTIWPAIARDARRGAWFRYHLALRDNQSAELLMQDAQMEGILVRRPVMPSPLSMSSELYAACPNALRQWEIRTSVPIYPSLSEQETREICRFLSRWRGTHLHCLPAKM